MKSLRQLFKRGIGPSSSHTMGPAKACERFLDKYDGYKKYKVVLYGSLALTGKGHGTDTAIKGVFKDRAVEVEFDTLSPCVHPNTMDLIAYEGDEERARMQVFSVGGGDIVVAGESPIYPEVYSLNTFDEIKKHCQDNNMYLWQYAVSQEGEGIIDYMLEMWQVMKKAAADGIKAEGVLPGGLGVTRRAKTLWKKPEGKEDPQIKDDRIVSAYAFAVSEQNASCGEIVTAPTCGASGVLPAVFMYFQKKYKKSDMDIVKALLASGIIGNLVKTNASISGAECGCQAEVGTACAMAAAGLAEMQKMTLDEIEYSAEIALEHHLGLTCDPVCGLVQIPCIERNAVAAMRAINAVRLASFLTSSRKVSLDTVIKTMYETGRDMHENYRETSIGGLAKLYR